MTKEFNPLHHPICLTPPNRLVIPNAWVEHIPFAMYLIDVFRPKVLVELGTEAGNSYCAFCQAVKTLKLSTKCYAVDTWQGDIHTGPYGPDVLENLRAHHDLPYSSFSRLIQTTFDEALEFFDDQSIDLLHIDGTHTYDGVKNDFTNWLPKVSRGGIILFHDTNVHQQDFGVWKFWKELTESYPTFEFFHGNGLGVLSVDKDMGSEVSHLFEVENGPVLREFFSSIGEKYTQNLANSGLQIQVNQQQQKEVDLGARVAKLEEEKGYFSTRSTEREQENELLKNQLTEREQENEFLKSRLTEREQENELLKPQLTEREQENEFLKTRLTEREQENELLKIQLTEREQENQLLTNQAQVLSTEIAGFVSSKSWKITSPLRRLSSGVKKGKSLLHVKEAYEYSKIKKSGLFDLEYYLQKYPDTRDFKLDPLFHFIKHGWIEGRNPSKNFDVEFYLATYPDVKNSGINPLIHYISHGKEEGRLPKPIETSQWEHTADQFLPKKIDLTSPEEFTAKIKSLLISNKFVISISNDDYLQTKGGVQVYISQEQRLETQAKNNYLHVYPSVSSKLLADDEAATPLCVNLNGVFIGSVDFDTVITTLGDVGAEIQNVYIHHTMGVSLKTISTFLALNQHKGIFWVHDKFSICPSYNLMRNDVEYCGAPDINSNACSICKFGNFRVQQQAKFLAFFEENSLHVTSPSKYALDYWLGKAPYKIRSSEPHPIARLDWLKPIPLNRDHDQIRIGFLGYPYKIKGWEAWMRLVSSISDEKISFFVFSSLIGTPGNYKRVHTEFSPEKPMSMIETLRNSEIDAVLLWSTCPETFSITMHEALAAGCFIITNNLSGNIQDYIKRNPDQGAVLDDEAALHEFIKDGSLVKRLEAYRANGKPQADLIWM